MTQDKFQKSYTKASSNKKVPKNPILQKYGKKIAEEAVRNLNNPENWDKSN